MKFAMITFAAAVGSANAGWQKEENKYCVGSVNGGRNRCSSVTECQALCENWEQSEMNPNQGTKCAGFRVSKHPSQKQANGFGETHLCAPSTHPLASNTWLDTYVAPVAEVVADATCVHEDCKDWNCDKWCECFDGTSCAAPILFFNRSLPAIAHSRFNRRSFFFALSSSSSSSSSSSFS